ncbi:MAG: efflux RND transporter periplasmic adaptor subunit [Candidatus Binatia bacterium]|nr:efflux RND transporter periplasmic adaptor subunit [Candidatus Binatia bacterium]
MIGHSHWFRMVWYAIAALALSAGCHSEAPRETAQTNSQTDRQQRTPVVLSPQARQTVPVQVATVQRHRLAREIRTTAVLEADENRVAHVSPRVPGRVVAVKALLGDTVQAGQLLATLDSLELGQAKAAYLTAKAHYEVARTTYEREQRLLQQQISSQREYLAARSEFLRAETQLQAARETLRLLGLSEQEISQLAWGKHDLPLSYVPLRAPFAGVVIEKRVTVGELLTPQDRPYTIADLSTLWAMLDIYEKDLGAVSLQAPVRVTVDAYPHESFQGTITYISDLLNQHTRTARARVAIANPHRQLKPGMFGTAVITAPAESTNAILAIPTSAVHRLREQPVAFVQEAEGVFVPRQLQLGRTVESYVEVLTGLHEGEQVVTQGGFYLKSALLQEEGGEKR